MKRTRAVRESVPPFFVGAAGMRIATASVRTGLAMKGLHRKCGGAGVRPYATIRGVVGRGMPYTHTYAYTLYTSAKDSQSLPPAGGKKIQIIFHRDMCVGKNTSQAASVEFCRLRQNYARSRLQTPLAENSVGIFCQ